MRKVEDIIPFGLFGAVSGALGITAMYLIYRSGENICHMINQIPFTRDVDTGSAVLIGAGIGGLVGLVFGLISPSSSTHQSTTHKTHKIYYGNSIGVDPESSDGQKLLEDDLYIDSL